jgi:Holliday junction DNA helicase RuvA
LFIFTYVKEDRLELYGFETQEHLQLFELLLDVSGVGPKTALDIVDRDPERIVRAVQNAEVSFFKAVPRIGKKTAQKIILDLKSKLGSLRELSLGPRSDKERDVYETLTALGYEESEIGEIITELHLEEVSVEQAVKQALKLLGS